MRKPAFVLGLVLALSPAARADEAATALVKDAVKAHGGEDKLKSLIAGRVEGKGSITVMGQEITMTTTTTYKLPDKNKSVLKMDVGGQTIEVLQLVNGGKVKLTAAGMAVPLPDEALDEIKDANVLQEVSLVYPLLDDNRFKLKALKEPKKFGEAEGKGVEVTHGKKTIAVYFDTKTKLVLAVEREGTDANQMKGKQVIVYSDYKEDKGVKYPAKSVIDHDGKRMMEMTVTKFERLEKIDDKEFALDD